MKEIWRGKVFWSIASISLILGLLFGTQVTAVSAQSKEEIVMLNAAQLSGTYAESGRDQSRGMQLAIDEFGGQVLGRKIRYVERDVPNPSEAVRKAKEAVEKEGVKFIQVGTSSGVALALMEYAKTQKVMVGALAGADSITGSACNKYSFRWQVPTYGAIREVIPKIIEKYNASTFTRLPLNISWLNLLKNTRSLEERGKKLLGMPFIPLERPSTASISPRPWLLNLTVCFSSLRR
jgi:branched-chain amino acid transport system substrate-binding protein